MNGKNDNQESINKLKICKPKAVRLCPPRRKKNIHSNHKLNSDKKSHQLNDISKKKLVNLEDISIEEINKDFSNYKENMEEEFCHNELLNIINNANKNKNRQNTQKIKRCKGPKNIYKEYMKESYFSTIVNEFNNLFLSEKKNI